MLHVVGMHNLISTASSWLFSTSPETFLASIHLLKTTACIAYLTCVFFPTLPGTNSARCTIS
jgi:hypothetical protein